MSNTKKYLDYEGVKYLWSKINMQDYPNNEILINVINAIDETKANKSELVQSDWNQNDPNALDYIKNKPDEQDALILLVEVGFVELAVAADGSIYTDENGKIYTLI
jgi:hypothetical protein